MSHAKFLGPICRYELSSEGLEDIPFVVEVNEEKEGLGVVRVKDGVHLDCDNPQYLLNVVAIRCVDDAHSERFLLQKTFITRICVLLLKL